MKISTEYDGKNLHLKVEVPPSEIKGLAQRLLDVLIAYFTNDEKGEPLKKDEKRGKGGS